MTVKDYDSSSSNLKQLEKATFDKLDELRKLPDDAKRKKNEDIKEMIRYYNVMTDTIEDRRNRMHNFSLQLLAISITGLVFIISQSARIQMMDLGRVLFWVAILIVSVLIVSSLISSFLFEMQSSFRYPFLDLEQHGNKWKWFYYGNKKILEINANPIFKSKGTEKTLKPYLNGLTIFISNYNKENLEDEITDNIQQLYLLQVHNYFKNRFYLQLTKVRNVTFFAVLIIIVSAILYCVLKFGGFITCILSLASR